MKKCKYGFGIIFFLILVSCNKMILDKRPLDIISDNEIWKDTVLLNSYITDIYARMVVLKNETPNTVFENQPHSENAVGPYIVIELSDEAKRNGVVGQNGAKYGTLNSNGGVLEWWESAYQCIRKLNIFINRVPGSPLDENYKKKRIAEARFLRAYNYFSLVKRYGGVPLLTEAQNVDDQYDSLYVKRNKEQEIYDFVIKELETAYADLPAAAATEAGRPSQGASLALKCRAALYAGSIAKYGKVQLDGVVGINASLANDYFTKARDAAKMIMDSKEYALYNADTDKVVNFKNVFLNETAVNKEPIFKVLYDGTLRSFASSGNSSTWDFYQCPKPQAWNGGNQSAPYLEMAEEFEYADGRSGTIDRTLLQSKLWDMPTFWAGREPRFYASIWTHGTAFKGISIDFHRALIKPDGTEITTGAYNGVAAQGLQNVVNFGTGFGIMKYLDETHNNLGERATSKVDWQVFRYGEVLLNYAEASFELNQTAAALTAVNEIRSRAGVASLSTIDMDKIKHERKVELAFEGHRYWDLRRWRDAESKLTRSFSALSFKLDYNTRLVKVTVVPNIDGVVTPPRFYFQNYYLPITVARVQNNKNLVENPGY